MKAMRDFIEWRDRNITHRQKVIISVVVILVAGMMFGYGMGAQEQYRVSASYIEIHAATDRIITIPGYGSYQVMPLNQTMTVNLTIPDRGK